MTAGMQKSIACRSCVGPTRPLGPGRHGLFRASSAKELGSRWFARSKMRRLDQLNRMTMGSLSTTWNGLLAGETNALPERAPKMPKAVFGSTNVAKSSLVKSQKMFQMKAIRPGRPERLSRDFGRSEALAEACLKGSASNLESIMMIRDGWMCL